MTAPTITLHQDMDPRDLLVVVLISSHHLVALLGYLHPTMGPSTLDGREMRVHWHELEEIEQRAKLREIITLVCAKHDVEPRGIFLSYSNVSLSSRMVDGQVNFPGLAHAIGRHEMDWALRIAEEKPVGTDQELLDLVPVGWEVHGEIARSTHLRTEEEKRHFPLGVQCQGLSCHALQLVGEVGHKAELVRLAQAAGYSLEGVIAQPAALYRGIASSLEGHSAVIIDCGARHTSFLVRLGDKLVRVRTWAYGGEDLVKRIADELGIPRDQAERLKRQVNITPTDTTDVPQATGPQAKGQQTIWTGIQAEVDTLLPAVARICRASVTEFFAARAQEFIDDRQHPLPKKCQIHLVGRASQLGGLTTVLEGIFGHKVILGSGKTNRNIGDELVGLIETGLLVSAIDQRRQHQAREGRGVQQILRSAMAWLLHPVE